jgi:hypothetical protein
VALNVEFCILVGWSATNCFHDEFDMIMAVFGLRWMSYFTWYWGGAPRSFADVFQEYLQVNWPYIAGGLMFLMDGFLLRFLAMMVRRGSRAAAVLASGMLGAIAVTVLGLTMWGLVAVIYETMLTGWDYIWFLVLLPVGVGMLILTLMVGAFRQLAWVARNPDLERPPLRFWPRSRRAVR